MIVFLKIAYIFLKIIFIWIDERKTSDIQQAYVVVVVNFQNPQLNKSNSIVYSIKKPKKIEFIT